MTVKQLLSIVSPKYSKEAYKLLLEKEVSALSEQELTECAKCLKYMLIMDAEDTTLPYIMAKFDVIPE